MHSFHFTDPKSGGFTHLPVYFYYLNVACSAASKYFQNSLLELYKLLLSNFIALNYRTLKIQEKEYGLKKEHSVGSGTVDPVKPTNTAHSCRDLRANSSQCHCPVSQLQKEQLEAIVRIAIFSDNRHLHAILQRCIAYLPTVC